MFSERWDCAAWLASVRDPVRVKADEEVEVVVEEEVEEVVVEEEVSEEEVAAVVVSEEEEEVEEVLNCVKNAFFIIKI